MAGIDLEGPWRAIVRAPLLRMATPFLVGILIGARLTPPTFPLLIIFLGLTVTVGILLLARANRQKHWQQGFMLMCWFLCFGMLWQQLRDLRSSPDHVERVADTDGPWLMRVVSINGVSSRTVRADAVVEHQVRDGSALPRKGSVMLTVLQGDEARTVHVGDRIWVDAPLTSIARVPDPGGFDRQKWAASQGISMEVFAPNDHWYIVGRQGHWTDLFSTARKSISEWLNGSDLPYRERALVKALVLGQRDELDSEQRTAFARSGTIHVLAVSGMHVGLIFTILSFMFGWWGSSDRARIIRGVVILLALWGYAGLTGGAPSVLRATIMFSLFTLANMSAQRTDHLNSLFAAALILLVWDPNMIMNIGFQLSFLAVLGIILFYKPLEGLWSPKSKVLRTIWSLAVVSISAQMLTTPISVVLFKAFPVWFLPANIVVVTAVGIAVYGAVALVFLYKVPVLGAVLTWLMTLLLKGVGLATDFFAELPGAYPDIRIGAWDVIFLYVCIMAFVAWWQWRWRSMRWVTMIAVLFVLSSWGLRADRAQHRHAFVVYDEREGMKAAMTRGREWVVLCDPTAYHNDPWFKRKSSAHRKSQGLSEPLLLPPEALRSEGISNHGSTVAGAYRWRSNAFDITFVSDVTNWPDASADAKFDVLVLHDLKHVDEERLDVLASRCSHLVLAGGIGWKVREMALEKGPSWTAQLHDIRSHGAFVLER